MCEYLSIIVVCVIISPCVELQSGVHYFRIIGMESRCILPCRCSAPALIRSEPSTYFKTEIGQIPNHGKTGHINHIHRAGAQKMVLVES